MRFIIPLEVSTDANGKEYTECHAIETNSDSAKTNKRLMKEYLTAQAVPVPHHKRVLKELGFWGRFGK